MRVYCQYSNISYDLTGFGSTQLTYIHPIFAAEPKWLLSRMGSWAAQKYTEEESKLLFLALLHTTELIEFRIAAQPENATVQLNMEQLARFVGWMIGLTRPQLVLPKFVINPENKQLKNIRYWIELWYEARKVFEDGYSTQSELRKLRDKEAALERLIRTSTKTSDDYAGLLSTWAFQAASVPKGLHKYWRELFCLKGIDVYNARSIDLQELLDHMEEGLEHGSIFAHATMQHVRTLVKKNAAGLNYGLGITDEDLAEIETTPFTIVEGSVEEHNMQVIAASAGVEEPRSKDFSSRVAYLRAHAAWKLAGRARQYAKQAADEAAEFTQRLETQLAADTEQNEEAAEDLDETIETIETNEGDEDEFAGN